MRSLFQFMGIASATVCAVLVASAMLSTLAVADVIIPNNNQGDCANYCQCNTNGTACVIIDNQYDCAGKCNCIIPTGHSTDECTAKVT
jgi:hypothetical protein